MNFLTCLHIMKGGLYILQEKKILKWVCSHIKMEETFPGLNSPNSLNLLPTSSVTFLKRSWRCWQGRVKQY